MIFELQQNEEIKLGDEKQSVNLVQRLDATPVLQVAASLVMRLYNCPLDSHPPFGVQDCLDDPYFPLLADKLAAVSRYFDRKKDEGVVIATAQRVSESSTVAVQRFIVALRWMGCTGQLRLEGLQARLYVMYIAHVAESYLKWKTLSVFSYLTDQEFPRPPKWVRPEDKSWVLWGGVCTRFIQHLKLKRGDTIDSSWISKVMSFLFVKKAMPPVSDEIVRSKVEEWKKVMTTPPTSLPLPDLQKYPGMSFPANPLPALVREVERTCDELFTERNMPGAFATFAFPSERAHYESPIRRGGALGRIQQRMKRACSSAVPPRDPYDADHPDSVLEFAPLLHPHGPEKDGWCCHLEESSLAQSIIDAENFQLSVDRYTPPFQPCHCRWKSFSSAGQYWTWLLDQAVAERNVVAPLGIKEPFKVRIISKGPPFRYAVCSYIQKMCHTALRTNPIFGLVGAPLTKEYLSRQIGDLDQFTINPQFSEPEIFVSGDFEAATDNLRKELSEAAVRRIARNWKFPPLLTQIFLDSLTGHYVLMKSGKHARPSVRDDEEIILATPHKVAKQMNGQLMGSPTSFPILCAVNAAIGRYCLEKQRQYENPAFGSLPLRKAPLAINGDDIVFRITPRFYQFWKDLCPYGGLNLSAGKNYISKQFAMINSRIFMYNPPRYDCLRAFNRMPGPVDSDPLPSICLSFEDWFEDHRSNMRYDARIYESFTFAKDGCRPRFLHEVGASSKWIPQRFSLVPFLNLGLVYGMKRSALDPSDDLTVRMGDIASGREDLGARAKDLIDGFPKEEIDSVISLFLRENRKLLEDLDGVPWFLPPWLGGLGIPTGRPLEEVATRQQICVAGMIAQSILTDSQLVSMAGFTNRLKFEKTAWDLISKLSSFDGGRYGLTTQTLVCTRGEKVYRDFSNLTGQVARLEDRLPQLLFGILPAEAWEEIWEERDFLAERSPFAAAARKDLCRRQERAFLRYVRMYRRLLGKASARDAHSHRDYERGLVAINGPPLAFQTLVDAFPDCADFEWRAIPQVLSDAVLERSRRRGDLCIPCPHREGELVQDRLPSGEEYLDLMIHGVSLLSREEFAT